MLCESIFYATCWIAGSVKIPKIIWFSSINDLYTRIMSNVRTGGYMIVGTNFEFSFPVCFVLQLQVLHSPIRTSRRHRIGEIIVYVTRFVTIQWVAFRLQVWCLLGVELLLAFAIKDMNIRIFTHVLNGCWTSVDVFWRSLWCAGPQFMCSEGVQGVLDLSSCVLKESRVATPVAMEGSGMLGWSPSHMQERSVLLNATKHSYSSTTLAVLLL